MISSETLLAMVREQKPMTLREQILLTLLLSVPGILSQFSSVAMEYIDASMVGHLGANDAASIGLVSTSVWLFMGLCSAASVGFSVQVAHRIGARDLTGARHILAKAFVSTMAWSILIMLIGWGLSNPLPGLLGADETIGTNASRYFFIFCSFFPVLQIVHLSSAMLRSSGNMRAPSLLNALMCLLDVVLNFFLIFPSRNLTLLGHTVHVPGFGLGVQGAALGTGLAMSVTAVLLLWVLLARSPMLSLEGLKLRDFIPTASILRRAFNIGAPIGLEHCIMNTAQILLTTIVAPLGAISIAANSFAITIEGLCYMPGFGISDASTTLVGQCFGAGRHALADRFARISISMGMGVMTLMGILMFMLAPVMLGMMTDEQGIVVLGTTILRIEAFAEPMFAAAIVCYGVFVGAGRTLVPSIMNLGSMWLVRLTLAFFMAPLWGLRGVWIAMCAELCFRGCLFLMRFFMTDWAGISKK